MTMSNSDNDKKLVIAMTGASGAVYGVRLLQHLRTLPNWESHLVMSRPGLLTATYELGLSRREIESTADAVHNDRDVGAVLASGSFRNAGMIVAPCSMKTLASIALGLTDSLVTRAADVAIKEQRKVALIVRETPLNQTHLRNMLTLAQMGVAICPPVPAFYAFPETIEDIVGQTIGRVLDLFGVPNDGLLKRWDGLQSAKSASAAVQVLSRLHSSY